MSRTTIDIDDKACKAIMRRYELRAELMKLFSDFGELKSTYTPHKKKAK